MRVVSGTARGRKLKTPDTYDMRPTTDNVKESIFNILMNRVEDTRVLDLFAGTGQLGIEAISRGAHEVVFIDNNNESLKIIKDNLKTCKFDANVIKADATEYLKCGGKFDLIFIDPPYDSDEYEKVFDAIMKFDILNPGGIIVVESRYEKHIPDVVKPYVKLREYKYGQIKITTFTREAK